MHTPLFMLAAAMALAGADASRAVSTAPGRVILQHCLVSLIEEVQVPAKESGVLEEMLVKEGQSVVKGQKLAQIDDTRARLEHKATQFRLQLASEQAKSDVDKRFAEAAALVAQSQVYQAEQANRTVAGSVPLAELEEKRLTHKKFLVDIEKAVFKMHTDSLEANVREAEVEAAADGVNRRQILAPLDGTIVERRRHAGEWVQPGDVVLKILQMKFLRIEGFLSAAEYSPAEIYRRPVSVRVVLPHGREEVFEGRVTYVNPQVEAGGEFRVWAEVLNHQENEQWLLLPGLTAEMTIHLK